MKKLTFEAACKKTGNDPNKLPNVEGLPEIQAKRIIADHILSIIYKATNGKWKADFSYASQIKWTGWLRWVPSRSAFVCTDTFGTDTVTGLGARFWFETEQKAYEFTTQNIDLINDLHRQE